jgi:hypothetical protein
MARLTRLIRRLVPGSNRDADLKKHVESEISVVSIQEIKPEQKVVDEQTVVDEKHTEVKLHTSPKQNPIPQQSCESMTDLVQWPATAAILASIPTRKEPAKIDHFFRLPREIRDEIFDFAYSAGEELRFSSVGDHQAFIKIKSYGVSLR